MRMVQASLPLNGGYLNFSVTKFIENDLMREYMPGKYMVEKLTTKQLLVSNSLEHSSPD